MSVRRQSLSRRLLRQFALLALLPLGVVVAAGVAVLLPMLLRTGDERNLELAIAIRDQVQQQLLSRQRHVLRLADEIAAAPQVGTDITASLHGLIDADPLLQVAYVTDSQGIVEEVALDESGKLHAADLLGLDQSTQPHYREVRRSAKPLWSRTFLSLLTGRITAVIAVPMGKRTLLVELALDDLSHMLAQIGDKSGTRAIILDRVGRVIGHPQPERAAQQTSLAHLPLVQRAAQGQSGADEFVLDGERVRAQVLPVPATGWSVLVTRPTSAVLAPLISLGQLLAASLAATLVLALWLARTLARRTGREVEHLAEVANAAANDPATTPPPKDFTVAEFQAVWGRLRQLFADLHERDRQTDAARRDLQAVLDAATEVAIIATDTRGEVTVFSQGAQKMLGYRAQHVVGRTMVPSWHDADELAQRGAELERTLGRPVEGFEVLVCQTRHAGYEVRDWTFVRADGRRVAVSLAVTAMHAQDGALRGFLGVAIDISQRKRADAMEVARRAAETASMAKSEFLSRMSHELRTPLNAVLGYAQLMEISGSSPPSAEQLQHLQQIQRSGWHLVQLIDDVLDLSRIEAGNLALAIAPLDAAQIIERAVEIVSPLMVRHGVAFSSTRGGGDAPLPRVLADKTRLVQVLVNLLSNATKYNHRGGRVQLEFRALEGSQLQLVVTDTGLGMDEHQLAQLYQPFNRLGREASAIPGSGIGLVITKRNVELMGGRIEVASQADRGTTVTVTLPAAPDTTPSAGAPCVAPAPGGAASEPAGGTVLCIEDNAENARLIREMMRQRPALHLVQATTLAEGLARARSQRPDLVLLDLHLPDARGAAALAGLRQEPATRDTAVVVISADATQAQIEQMLAAGVRDYLTKPIDLVRTLKTIDEQLARHA